MYLEWIKYFLLSIVLLPVQLLAQVAPEEPVQDVDGAGATSGWWWFWVILLLVIVAFAIWWASKPGATKPTTKSRGGPTVTGT
jgi:hypothetical protein